MKRFAILILCAAIGGGGVGYAIADWDIDNDGLGRLDLRPVDGGSPNIHRGCMGNTGYTAYVNANKYDVITLMVMECDERWPTGTVPYDCHDGCAIRGEEQP